MREYTDDDSAKAHKKARRWKWAAAASVVGTAGASAVYLADGYRDMLYPDDSGLREEMFGDLYSKYGCSNGYEFDAFLESNSHVVKEVLEIDGEEMVFTHREYTELAQAASDEYWDIYSEYMAAFEEMTSHSADINLEPVFMLLTIPVIILAVYLYQRHKCKKIDRAIRKIEGL